MKLPKHIQWMLQEGEVIISQTWHARKIPLTVCTNCREANWGWLFLISLCNMLHGQHFTKQVY